MSWREGDVVQERRMMAESVEWARIQPGCSRNNLCSVNVSPAAIGNSAASSKLWTENFSRVMGFRDVSTSFGQAFESRGAAGYGRIGRRPRVVVSENFRRANFSS